MSNKCIKCKQLSIEHKRVNLCSICYKLKRKQDWIRSHDLRMQDTLYAENRLNKQHTYIKKWKENNKQKVNENSLLWKSNNPEKVAKLKKKWYQNNKEKVKKIDAQKHKYNYNNNEEYKLKHLLRSRLYKALKNNYKVGSAIDDLGCSIEQLKQYLQSKFEPEMTWSNHGEWHIDHIKPLASFDLTDPEEFKKACHYTNLQPLWAKDNLSKGDKDE